MDFFTFLLTAIIAFFGLLTGAVLSHYSHDEVHAFKKYLPMLQLACFILAFIILYTMLPFVIASALLVLTFAFIYFFWRKKNLNVLDYIALAILFALTTINLSSHLYMTTIIFAFGVFSGALYYVLHTKPPKKAKEKNVSHHKHRGHHEFGHLVKKLLNHYSFFLVLTLVTWLVANFACKLV